MTSSRWRSTGNETLCWQLLHAGAPSLYGMLRQYRFLVQYKEWVRSGRKGSPRPYFKHITVKEYGRRYGLKVFVETGTYMGDMLYAVRKDFDHIYFIELSPVEPCLFWLDGHFSGGVTARGGGDTPVAQELEAIFRHPVRDHVFLVDDARHFTGHRDYPTLDQVKKSANEAGYAAEAREDIIRIHRSGK